MVDVALGDSLNGTNGQTGAASHASVSNNVSHSCLKILDDRFDIAIFKADRLIGYKSNVFFEKCFNLVEIFCRKMRVERKGSLKQQIFKMSDGSEVSGS